jgi:hypothetical protein
MAYCQILENSEMTPERAEQVLAHVKSTGPVLPDGARLLVMGPAEEGMRVVTIWDSHEQRERFLEERLAPAYEQAGLSLDRSKITVFEVLRLTAGDLTGAPQPA